MAFCVNCGMRIADGEQKCAACAAKMNPSPGCPNCGQPYSSPTAKFCMSCGTPRVAVQPGNPPVAPPAQPGTPVQPVPQAQTPPPAPPTRPEIQPPTPAAVPPAQTGPGSQSQPTAAPPATGQNCPHCGMPIKITGAKFCVYCAAALTTTPPPVAPVSEVSAQTPPEPETLSEIQQSEVEAVTQQRLTAYQRIGRRFITACRQGILVPDQLPQELAGELNQALEALQNGHNRLARAGICPRCQDVALNPGTGQCPKCGLAVTT